MGNQETFHGFVETSKDVSALLREFCILALIFLLLFKPDIFKLVLSRVGISKMPTPFGDIDVAGAGGTIAHLNRGVGDITDRLQQIEARTTDPARKQDLQILATSLQDLRKQAQDGDAQVKSTLATQQASLQQSAPQSVQTSGWLFLGHVDDAKTGWSGEGAKNVDTTVSPALKLGDQFVLSNPAYLYSDAPTGHHLEGKIIGVFPLGSRVSVIADPEYSHALAGGYFLWVKVSRAQ